MQFMCYKSCVLCVQFMCFEGVWNITKIGQYANTHLIKGGGGDQNSGISKNRKIDV